MAKSDFLFVAGFNGGSMEKILAVCGYTVKQHLRHKLYITVILFGMVLITGSVLISSLSTGRLKMLVDLGLAGIEFMALVTVIFTTVNLVIEEMESRTIYLMLTHSLERRDYIIGRYAGTVISVLLVMAVMMLLHLTVLFVYGWSWQGFYLIAWLCSAGKVIIVSAIALLFSLFTTSAVSSMSLTILAWILGHFSEELKFLGEKSANVLVKGFVWAVYHITPNFSYYNYRDFASALQTPPAQWFGWMLVYTAAYTGICLVLSNFLFSQKEF